MKQIITVRAIIKHNQDVLLCTDGKDLEFDLPGGELNFGLAPEDYLRQTLTEELHYSPKVLQLSDVVSSLSSDRQQQEVSIIFLVSFGADIAGIDLSGTKRQYRWQKMSDIQRINLRPAGRGSLKLYDKEQEESLAVAEENVIGVSSTTNNYKEIIIHTDGGSRGNPGPSAAGFVVLTTGGEIISKGGSYLGITTNNQAEYQAVRLGLERALELGARVVKFKLDSLLVVNQMVGLYQIKNRDLWPIYASIKELIKKFENVTFQHVRREFNSEADALVNKTLDEHKL